MLTAIALGFALGLRHAFDPDHVLAVSTIASRHRSPWTASWIGASWGVGHGATILAVGFAVIGLHLAIPERLVRAFELGVGLMLVGLGIANLLAARAPRAAVPASLELPMKSALARSGLLGLAHGLAGSAPVALLATAAMPTAASALVYLAVFGAATTVGMVAFSLALGTPLARFGHRVGARRLATAGTGLLSLGFGTWLVYAIGFAGGAALPT